MKMNSDHTFGGQVKGQVDFDYPSHVEAIEDIEHPAWTSSSFSESCGSCLSRISNLCLDNGNGSPDSIDSRLNVNRQENNMHDGITVSECMAEPVPQEEEDNENDLFVLSGSLQSLSSSSKTIYASPRSNSENLLHFSQNRFLEGKKTVNRQVRLYRERAPSENALDFSNLNVVKASKLSHSLHDVSSIPSNGLKNPSHKSYNTTRASLSALHLRNRSRDSGFIRADSLLSLSSGSRNYDHVESKVKQYIQSIKEADAVRKKERAQFRDIPSVVSKPLLENQCTYHDGPELLHVVEIMKNNLDQKDVILKEKDQILLKLQEDYNNLLGKYAEAENKIDKLRFGWCQSVPAASQSNTTCMLEGQPPSSFVYKQIQDASVLGDTDNCSLNSSMMLSNFDLADSFNTSIQPRVKFLERKKKDITASAPLRPISSLYCTSARLDKVITPLNSKSSVCASSISSSEPLNNKAKKHVDLELPDVIFREGTTDTGIESCCPQSGEGFSATPLPLKSGPIGHLPHEDPMLKVQRWRKSLPVSCYTDSQSPCHPRIKQEKEVLRTDVCDEHELMVDKIKVKVNSVGIQVNEALEFPSLASELTLPIIPCLNLGELSSGGTDEFSRTVPLSEQQILTSIPDSNSTFQNSCSIQEPHLNLELSKIPETSIPAKHLCEGLCKVCGSSIVQDIKFRTGNGQVQVKKVHGRDQHSLPERRGLKAVSQLSVSDLAKLSSLICQDQDHVVPASPDDEKSYQLAFRILKKKLSSLERSRNFQTIISLLDILIRKELLEKSSSHDIPVKADATVQVTSPKPEPVQDCYDDGSLLQCLEELDEYTHQVWAKTESFLEVLNSKEQSSSIERK